MTPVLNARSIYPIGEFPDGHRLCASVTEDGVVDWFPEHRDFDLGLMDETDAAPYLRDADVRSWPGEIPDDAQTLRNAGTADALLEWD